MQGGNSTYNDMVASRTEAPDGSVLYYKTHEDAPLWPDQLPEFFDAEDPPRPFQVIYRTSCYPNLASQYQMFDNGVIQYQPEPNINGQDYMTYFGLVAESVAIARGLVAADLVDCDNKVENMCVTNTVLANILIEPRNDAPVAANAEPVLYFTSTADFIVANNEQDETARHQLPSTGASPQRLIRNLVGYDVTGPTQVHHHGSAAARHAEIIQEGLFFYVPDPGFMGATTFSTPWTIPGPTPRRPCTTKPTWSCKWVSSPVCPKRSPEFLGAGGSRARGKFPPHARRPGFASTFTYVAVTSRRTASWRFMRRSRGDQHHYVHVRSRERVFQVHPDANYYGEDRSCLVSNLRALPTSPRRR